ncbi:MAG: response regulator, partial [Planctomycetota bacterium]
QSIIQGLRKYARPQGEGEVEVHLSQAIAQACERLRRRGSPLPSIHSPEIAPLVSCGRSAMVRVIEQILDNALRAGASRVQVSAQVDAGGKEVEIILANDGSTPSEEHIRDAMRPFRSHHGGAGLGLAVAQSLLGDYRGKIHLEVGPDGRGAAVRMILPLWSVNAAQRARDIASSDELTPPGSLAQLGHVLLIIEDDPLVAELLASCAEATGWVARQATSLAEARAALALGRIGGMVVDVRVGKEDGIAFAREHLQAHPAMAPRVMIMSGDIDQPQVHGLLADWDCRSMSKPFHLDQLRLILQEWLKGDA